MCPECVASVALLVTDSIVSTGGATAAVKILGNKESRYQVSSTYQPQPTHATTFRPRMG